MTSSEGSGCCCSSLTRLTDAKLEDDGGGGLLRLKNCETEGCWVLLLDDGVLPDILSCCLVDGLLMIVNRVRWRSERGPFDAREYVLRRPT